MSVPIRRTLFALGVLAVAFVGLAIWLIATFDAAQYKGLAVEWMKTQRDRTLTIDGPIKLSVFPRLQVRLSRISLSEVGKPDEFAGLDHAELALELLPLLRGQLSVGRLQASGVRLALLRDAKGRRNIDDLVQSSAATPASTSSSKPIQLDIKSIRLSDVRARIKDDASGIDGELLLKELSAGRIASQVSTKVKLVAQIGLKSPALKGELRGSCEVTPDLDSGSLRLTDMDLGYRGDAPSASSIDATVKGELAFDAARGAIDARALSLRVSANAAGIKLADSTLAIGRFSHDATRKRIAIGQLKMHLAGTQAGQALEFALEWPELDVSGETLKGSPLSGRFARAGDFPIEATFKSGAPSGNFDNVRIPAFEARVNSTGAARRIDGTVRGELVLQPEKQSIVLERLGLEFRLDDPALKPVTLTLLGQAGASAQGARWSFAGQLNANGFTTDGMVNLTHTTPNVKANARFEALDLNAVLPPNPAGGSSSGNADGVIDLSALRSVNGSLALRAGSVALRTYRVTDVLLDAALETGVLRVSALHGGAWGGTIDATAIADARASRIAVKASANAVNINALLKDVTGKDLLEGNGRLVADIDTAGRSVAEMKSRMKGAVAMHLRDGAVKGINLAKSLRQAKAAISARRDAAERAVQTEKTDFSELSASFQIDAGVARSHDLDLKSPYLRLGGEGAIDIGKGRIDYTARTTVTDTSKGQGGADLAALKGLTIPVKMTGPLDAIDWRIRWSAVAAGAVKSQVEGKLKEMLVPRPAPGASAPAAPEKLKDKLKGLFK